MHKHTFAIAFFLKIFLNKKIILYYSNSLYFLIHLNTSILNSWYKSSSNLPFIKEFFISNGRNISNIRSVAT